MMTRKATMALAAFGSAAILAGAFGFQYWGGLAPCVLCLWQRWPHAAAVAFGALGVATGQRLWAYLGALSALATAGIGAFHVGVEQKWWAGLDSCTASSMDGASIEDLLNPEVIIAAPIRCDEIAWALGGISMAGWNVILSVVLALIWLKAARRA